MFKIYTGSIADHWDIEVISVSNDWIIKIQRKIKLDFNLLPYVKC